MSDREKKLSVYSLIVKTEMFSLVRSPQTDPPFLKKKCFLSYFWGSSIYLLHCYLRQSHFGLYWKEKKEREAFGKEKIRNSPNTQNAFDFILFPYSLSMPPSLSLCGCIIRIFFLPFKGDGRTGRTMILCCCSFGSFVPSTSFPNKKFDSPLQSL